MPIFEFRCQSCGKKFSALIGMTSEPDDEMCPHCASSSVSKLVSRVARYRTEDDRVGEIADRLDAMDEPDSPAEMRQMVKEMGKALDEDVSDEIEEMFEADIESGDDGSEPLDD